MKQNETEAFVLRHYDAVFRYVHYRMGGSEAAADVTQEVFLKYCRHACEQGRITQPQAYLFAIARNAIAEHYRSQLPYAPIEEKQATDEYIEAYPMHDALRRAMSSLPEEQREAIVLKYVCDMSVARIAAVLHVPQATVKSRLRLGKQKLRLALKEDGK